MGSSLLDVRDLQTLLTTRRGTATVVDRVSFTIREGETLGLVGESGSGKSMTCLSIIRLLPDPIAQIAGGQVLFEGQDLLKMTRRELRRIRGGKISLILQDPLSSLNPAFTIGHQVAESVRLHRRLTRAPLWNRVFEVLAHLRIPSPSLRAKHYPHQLSGGMRQRVVGAIALSCEPRLLIADEPTTSLDVTIQAQYLDLLREIQQATGLAILFVTHDFGIVARLCDRVAVMYAGKIVEEAPVRDLFTHTSHPYTEALLRSVPPLKKTPTELSSIAGQPPSLHELPSGCAFSPRCPYVMARCHQEVPPFFTITPSHRASCWRLAADSNA